MEAYVLFSAYLPVQNMNLGLTLKAEAIHLTHNVLKSFLEKYYQLYIIILFPNKRNLINIFLVVRLGIVSVAAKPYIPQKSLSQ